jgi:hypothetical protein
VRTLKQWLLFSVLVLIVLNGCNISNTKQNDQDLFQWKDSYVGDNNAVGSIARQLPGSEYLNGFELKTVEEPYGIILNYDGIDTELNYEETAIFNASYLFALVQNADWITFKFEGQEFNVTKEKLENWYDVELKDYTNEEDLTELTQKNLEDEIRLKQFFE